MRRALEDIGGELGLELAGVAGDRLEALVRLWRAYAPAINLVGAHDDAAMLGHVGDGLATVACAGRLRPLGAETTWLDVGSGAGLPGLVVAAVTECRLALVEPRQRRASFLDLALATIGREAVVSRTRIDEKTWCESYAEQEIGAEFYSNSIVSARAVMDPEAWLTLGEKLVMDGGVVIAHLRPGQVLPGRGAPDAAVAWGRSNIAAFRTPLRDRST